MKGFQGKSDLQLSLVFSISMEKIQYQALFKNLKNLN